MFSDFVFVFNKNIFFKYMRRRSDEVCMELENYVNGVEDIGDGV